jgi:hypothetical protein
MCTLKRISSWDINGAFTQTLLGMTVYIWPANGWRTHLVGWLGVRSSPTAFAAHNDSHWYKVCDFVPANVCYSVEVIRKLWYHLEQVVSVPTLGDRV